jgi:pimeloyl-ACP methyl ester carboxylesterase
MQFAYQFPEICERLVLVASGGLGKELHPLLRAAVLPGAEWALPLLCSPGLRGMVDGIARLAGRAGLRTATDVRELWRGYLSLFDAQARQAFLLTLRSLVDIGGQRASALDRLYLASNLPTLIVWGENDPMIPVAHAEAARLALPMSRVEIFSNAGHFPHLEAPLAFVKALVDFMQSTEPVSLDRLQMRELLRSQSDVVPPLDTSARPTGENVEPRAP